MSRIQHGVTKQTGVVVMLCGCLMDVKYEIQLILGFIHCLQENAGQSSFKSRQFPSKSFPFLQPSYPLILYSLRLQSNEIGHKYTHSVGRITLQRFGRQERRCPHLLGLGI
jgi:hypothetical protein